MSKMITTTVVKPHMAPNGIVVQRGETIEVDEARHRALVRKGYVPRPVGEEPEAERIKAITNSDFSPRRSSIADPPRQKSKQKASPESA